jgi:hypothetical protein
MGKTVHLNGGPWHDRTVTLADDRDHFHIAVPMPNPFRAISIMSDEEAAQPVPRREGMYSQVFREPGEFEWDGWRSHD